ncbi:MAG: aminopeptidase N [Nocardioides sp.]
MSLTLAEARARVALLSDVVYDVALDLTDRETFALRATVRFDCAAPGADTFLELTDALDLSVTGVTKWSYDGRRIQLSGLAASNEVRLEARLRYVTDGDGMHTFTDPADGETYVSAYIGMDVAQRVFPCFDQNDLKAPVTLQVTAPESWTVLANARPTTVQHGRWEFATTPPIPTAMFVVCAGPWHSVTWEHTGPDGRTLPFGWHARASLAGELDRDDEELRRVTEQCFDHYSTIFDEAFAFDSYDQAFVPGQNWGALETPGCVTYRDEYLPIGRITAGERRRRATVIAHEMAHMWFGDLVTMRWWEDTWLNESFADYMGFRVVEEAAGFAGSFVDFTVGRKPGGYAADERRSTHPVAAIAEEVADVDLAAGNFDSISYAKGNSVLRQLVTWLGDEAFLAGVNAYLTRHRFGNATLADFVDALDSVTDRDVRAWAEVWLRTTGFDTLRVIRDADGPVLVREGSRPHRVRVASYDASLARIDSRLLDLDAEPVRLHDAEVVVPNSSGETFARIRLDQQSWDAVVRDLASIEDHDTRATLWSNGFDLVRCGELPAQEFLGLVTRHLPREPEVSIVESVLSWTRSALIPRHLQPEEVIDAVAQVAAACESGLASEPDPEVAVVLSRSLAETTPDAVLLEQWLVDRATHTGIELDPTMRWSAIRRLAALGALNGDAIDDERAGDGTVVGQLGAARAMAAIPHPEAKERAWARMFEDPHVSNRTFEATAQGFWDPEQVPLVHPYVARYLAEAPAVAAARGQAYSLIVGRAFPNIPLGAADLAALEDALAGDVPTVLRRQWEDRLDDLRLALSR